MINDYLQSPGSEQEIIADSIMQRIHVALPGIVQAFNPSKKTATIVPAIRRKTESGFVNYPILLDVPVFLLSERQKILPNDDCLVIFADGCIDAWYQSGGIQNPSEVRMHDLSDGFAFVGFRSQHMDIDRVPVASALPVAAEALRGQMMLLETGNVDTLYTCEKTSVNTYEWVPAGGNSERAYTDAEIDAIFDWTVV